MASTQSNASENRPTTKPGTRSAELPEDLGESDSPAETSEREEPVGRKDRDAAAPVRRGKAESLSEKDELKGQRENQGGEDVPEKLAKWEKAIDKYRKATLEAAPRVAWITEEGLYRKRGYDTIGTYAEERFGISRQRWYQLSYCGEVLDQLRSKQKSTAVDIALPSNEAQTRPLQSHRGDPDFLWTAWTKAVEEHGSSPRRKDVKRVVGELTSENSAPASSAAENGSGERDREDTEGGGSSAENACAKDASAKDASAKDASAKDASTEDSGGTSGTGGSANSVEPARSEHPVDRDSEEGNPETNDDPGQDSDDENPKDQSSEGLGEVASSKNTDEEPEEVSSDEEESGSESSGEFTIDLPSGADDPKTSGSSSPTASPTKKAVEDLAEKAEQTSGELPRSSADHMVASKFWNVLVPDRGSRAGLPEENTSEEDSPEKGPGGAVLKPGRLDQITGLPQGIEPERVLVCPGIDLFAGAVPSGVIEALLARCRKTDHSPVVFTRHLDRASEFDLSGLWVGTPAERGSLSSASQSLKSVASAAAVRWILYNVKNEDRQDPPSYSEVLDWVVFDPPGGAGVHLTIGETQALIGAAQDGGARWAFRSSFKTNGASSLPTADKASDDDGEDDDGEASSTQGEAF